ncbi:diversity-generating retroelement protein Avd [Sulfurimonas sp.]
MDNNNNYPVVVKSYNLTLWYIKKLSTLPKNHRFSLGQSIQEELISLLLCLTEAIYTKEKREILKKANLHIEKLRLLTKLLKDLEILSEKNRRFIGESLAEIGSMVGGWLKNAK